MLFTKLGWPIAMVVGLYGVFDLVWIFSVQYSAVFGLDVAGAENWGRVARESGLLNDVGVALQRIGFAVVLGVLAEISNSLAAKRSE
jgi:hypothetical protein